MIVKHRKTIYYPVVGGGLLKYFSPQDDTFSDSLKEKIRFYNKNQEFYHPYLLCSALNSYDALNEEVLLKDQLYITNPDCSLFIDSGGFQTLTLSEDKMKKWSSEIALEFSEKNGDIFPIYDKPLVKEDNNSTIKNKLEESCESAKYYVENRTKQECIILNVVSGANLETTKFWYEGIRKYKLDGWAHGGNLGNIKSIVQTLILLILNGEFDTDRLVNYHIFGSATNKVLLYLARIQYNLNKRYNIQLSCDSSSPLISALRFGKVYTPIGKLMVGMKADFTLSKGYDYSKLIDGIKIPLSNDPIIEAFNKEINITKCLKGLNSGEKVSYISTAIAIHNLNHHIRTKEFLDNLMFFDCYDIYREIFDRNIVNSIQAIDHSFEDIYNGIQIINREFIDTKILSDNNSTNNILKFF